MFTMLMGERRTQMFDFIEKLPDYQGFNKAEIVEAGLDMIITNAQQPKTQEKLNFFLEQDDILTTCREKSKDPKFKEQLEAWVKTYNEVSEL
jgi:hypothetical protein